MDIAQIREKYPQYADIPDMELLMGLHRKLYSDMHLRDFLTKIDGGMDLYATAPKGWAKDYYKEQISKPMDGETPDQTARRIGGSSDGVDPGGALGAAARSAFQGMTFGAGDEIVAGVASALDPNLSYDQYLTAERKRLGMGRDQYPKTALASEIAGAMALPGAAMKGMAEASLPVRMAAGAGLGAGGGAAYGFMSGEGGLSNRANEALSSGLIGGGIGAGIPVLGSMFKAAVKHLSAARAAREAGKRTASATGVSNKSGRALSEIMRMQDEAAMREALAKAGPDAMLAEGSYGLSRFLDEAVNSPGSAASVAIPRVNDAITSRMGKASATMDNIMGAPEGMKGAQSAIREATAAERSRLYSSAYDTPIDWRAPGGEELRFELQNLPPSVAAKAREIRDYTPKPFQSKPDAAYMTDIAPEVSIRSGLTADEADRVAAINSELAAGRAAMGQTGGKRPFTYYIKSIGGIDPRGKAAQDLYAQGITPQTIPGLFRNGGRMDLDNLDVNDFPESIRFSGGDGTGNYASQQQIIDGIVDEARGAPLRTSAQEEAASIASDYLENSQALRAERKAINDGVSGRARLPTAPTAPGDPVPIETFRDADVIKRALDEVWRTNNGAGLMGGTSEIGRLANQRSRRIRELLTGMSEDYAKALEVSGDTIRQVEAVKIGGKMLSPSLTREDLALALDGASKSERDAMMKGLRQFIDDTIARVKAVPSDPNVDAREATRAFSLLSSRDAREKVAALLGADQSASVFKQLDELGSVLGLRANIARGSGTAPRQSAEQIINGVADPSLLRQGKVMEAGKEIAATAMGASRAARDRMRASTRADLADVLTRQNGSALMQQLMAISRETAADPNAGYLLRQELERRLLGGTGSMSQALNERFSPQYLPRP